MASAGAAGDELVAAHAYANMSMLAAAAEQPRKAVQYAEAGQRAALRRGGPRLRALLLAREAQAHAGLRDRSAASDALTRAERAYCTSRGEDPTWTAFFDEAELAGAAGSAFQTLGDRTRATRYLQDATEIHGRTRNRLSWTIRLASAHADSQDYAQACAVANPALPAIGDIASTRILRDIRRFSAQLGVHSTAPEVQDFRRSMSAVGLAS